MRLKKIRQAVVLAGGFGRRMWPETATQPKPMIQVAGRPFLERLIEWTAGYGITEALILGGWKCERLAQHFGDGKRWGLRLRYSFVSPLVETTLRLKLANRLLEEAFLLLYGDNFCPFDLTAAEDQWVQSGLPAQLTVYENTDGYSRANVRWRDRRLLDYDPGRTVAGLRGVDIGFAFLNRALVDEAPCANRPIAEVMYPALAGKGLAAVFPTTTRYCGPSHPSRLARTAKFFSEPPTAIVLEREGLECSSLRQRASTIGESGWEWKSEVARGFRVFRRHGWRVVLVLEDAKTASTKDEVAALESIRARMFADVAQIGGRLDDLVIPVPAVSSETGFRMLAPNPMRAFSIRLAGGFFEADRLDAIGGSETVSSESFAGVAEALVQAVERGERWQRAS